MRVYVTVIGLSLTLVFAACSTSKRAGGNATVDPVLLKQRTDSLFFAAQRSKMIGDYRAALSQYSDYLKLDRSNAVVFYEIARLLMETHSGPYALNFARKAATMDTSNHWFQQLLADAYAVSEKFDSGAMVYKNLARKYPENDDYLYNQGVLLSKANKLEAALAVFNQLEQKTGVVEEVTYQKQRLLLRMSKADEAAAEIKRLIDTNPSETRYYYLLAEVYDANDQIADATAVYNDILSRDPENARALIALGSYAKKRQDMPAYWDYMTRAFANNTYSIDEKVAYVYPYLRMLETDTTKLQEGLQLAHLIVAAHPNDAKSYALLGDMYSQGDILDSAQLNYQRSLSLDSTRFSVWYQQMWITSRKDDANDLLTLSDTVTRLFPKEFMGFYFNGLANYLLRQYPATIVSMNKALALGDAEKRFTADVYSLLGDAYHATGQNASSDSSYEKALLLRPKDATVLNNYSYYLSLRGENLSKAAEMSRRSLEIDPESPTFMDTYAWILFRQQKYQEAKEWMDKAFLFPASLQNASMLEHYGDILYNLNDVNKAVEYWQMAQEKGASSVALTKKIAEKRYVQ
ncbi:Tetratricopeptide repeat-containing protein [Chitinophaga jiangningensis]|uniref:Tetratricopeptide repeat-containing protein n=1 Tax=Chitinophaga jiangningensis TaxID=1419482 RepID=A0A1M7HAX0_9BACT|nr:tetratricopeptide repeat protein [Chitinophaga jiangningensis]SHM25570.1 Tetratricopeptide repeat-containing protein [Chitinophaga jiangningensis]